MRKIDRHQLHMIVSGIGCGTLLTISILLIFFLAKYKNRIYPNIYINNSPVGGLTKNQALDQIVTINQSIPDFTLTLMVDDIAVSSSSAELGYKFNYAAAVEQAFNTGRSSNPWRNLTRILSLYHQPNHLNIETSFQPEPVLALVQILANQVDYPPQLPQISLAKSQVKSSIEVNPGKIGRQVEVNQAVSNISQATNPTNQSLKIPIASVGAQLQPEQIKSTQLRAEKLVGKKAAFKYQDITLPLNDTTLISLLGPIAGLNEAVSQKLIEDWAKLVDREPQNAEFIFNDQTLEVSKFTPHRNGLKLDEAKTKSQLQELLDEIARHPDQTEIFTKEITLSTAQPEFDLSQTNNLGIKELIGFGESYYAHSIPGRIHNVALTADRINNTIVKPGAEFSFNQTLGDVSSATGFQPAHIIQAGKTVLGDGGGVCQVSSTLFRSLLNAGLKITRRLPHSYRVSYYELNSDPGFDATVYSGETDLRFINDTNRHLIIHTETDSKKLWMKVEIFGTSDGRTAEISEYKKWGYRPAPATQYFPDPTLPHGQLKQIDWSASGINTSFKYTVKDKDGQIKMEKVYESHYQPWAAKYLQGV